MLVHSRKLVSGISQKNGKPFNRFEVIANTKDGIGVSTMLFVDDDIAEFIRKNNLDNKVLCDVAIGVDERGRLTPVSVTKAKSSSTLD